MSAPKIDLLELFKTFLLGNPQSADYLALADAFDGVDDELARACRACADPDALNRAKLNYYKELEGENVPLTARVIGMANQLLKRDPVAADFWSQI